MDVFVARQPIFNPNEKVEAYEMLFRQNFENRADFIDGDQATIDVLLNTFIHIGLNQLTKNQLVFVNFSENLLIKEIPTHFPKEILVIEILENAIISDELIESIKALKEKGYRIALDDFISIKHFQRLIPFADIIKIDFLDTTLEDRKLIKDQLKQYQVKWLAEKVETREQFNEAIIEGYDYFQGYFFCKPDIIQGKSMPSFFSNYTTLLKEFNNPEPDINKITMIIEGDLALSYNLLKLMNHAAYTTRYKITSIRQAIMLIGLKELKKWLTLLLLKETDHRCADEIIRTLLSRAKTLESLAKQFKNGYEPSEFFLLGMFSMIDTLLSVPMNAILKDLPLDDELKQALLGVSNKYSNVLELVIFMESGDWKKALKYSSFLHLNPSQLFKLYHESIIWSDELMGVNTQETTNSL